MGWEMDSFSSLLINFLTQTFSGVASSFLRLLGRRPEERLGDAASAMFAAKNPPVNRLLVSDVPRGVFFGARGSQYVAKPENMDGHVLVVGTPGSGKSSCVAIPTLRHWRGSVFAIDVKGELYENTKQYRRNIRLFDPEGKFSPAGEAGNDADMRHFENNLDKENPYSYDPFIFLNESTNPAQEARAIAQAIIPLPHDAKEPFWVESAQIILTGAILHFHHEQKSFIDTLKNIQRFSPRALIKIVSESGCEKAVLCVQSFADIDGKVLAGIAAEISRGIVALVTDDDLVAALTPEDGRKTITPADLQNGADIYIKIPEHLLKQWKNLLTLMTNQFISFFERRAENPDNRPILFLLDEFPRLGKIPAITDALATLRSKKITICLMVQSLAQIEMIYGHDARKVIADTCAFKAILGATDADTQEYFSKLVGTYEKIRTSQSQNFDPYIGAPTGHGTSSSQDYEKRII